MARSTTDKTTSNGVTKHSANGTNGRDPNHVTIPSQDERIQRFAKWLSAFVSYPTIAAAMDPAASDHAYALVKCQKAARDHGKGWPHAWPKA